MRDTDTDNPNRSLAMALEDRPRRFASLTRGMTRNVFVLGMVSLFTDISSEMLAPIRILFFVYTLGTPVVIAGLIEGLAESTSSLLKVVSGRMSDRVPRKKPLIVAGYSVSNIAKPFLAFITTWQPGLGLVIVDRFGKGIRSSPRDAMLAEAAAPEYRGKVFGFHRGMDTLGAAVGPLLTVLILSRSGVDLRPVFAWAAVPGAISIILVLVFLRERRRQASTDQTARSAQADNRSEWQRMVELGRPFWIFTGIATLFAVANSSDAFIFLRAQGLERTLEAVPLAYFGYNVVYAVLSPPLGALSDRFGRIPILITGFMAFGVVYQGFAVASQPWHVWTLFLLYGVYGAATEGVGKAFVSDLIPRPRRGTAMGWYNGTVGLAALPANLLGGWLWTQYGPQLTFQVDATIGFLAATVLLFSTGLLTIPGKEKAA